MSPARDTYIQHSSAQGISCRYGMTLVELLMALMVTAIVLAGVATLSFALGGAKDSSDDASRKQAYLRFAMVQLAEAFKCSKLVCYSDDQQVVLWTADRNLDGKMNLSEIACLWTDTDRARIVLSRFSATGDPEIPLASAGSYASKWWLAFGGKAEDAEVLPQCAKVSFATDAAAPAAHYVSVSFDMTQNGLTAGYGISGSLRGRAGNLLDTHGNIVPDDD
jgi:prepilin-type N-terminal cleavage/methylation domain-containing protein